MKLTAEDMKVLGDNGKVIGIGILGLGFLGFLGAVILNKSKEGIKRIQNSASIKTATEEVWQQFLSTKKKDLDLPQSFEFSKEERAALEKEFSESIEAAKTYISVSLNDFLWANGYSPDKKDLTAEERLKFAAYLKEKMDDGDSDLFGSFKPSSFAFMIGSEEKKPASKLTENGKKAITISAAIVAIGILAFLGSIGTKKTKDITKEISEALAQSYRIIQAAKA